MTEFFNPIVTIEVGQPGALPLRLSSLASDGSVGLRLAATVKLTSSRQDNVTEITAYGLEPATCAAIQAPGALCRVLAGWRGIDGRGQPSQIAAGRVLPATWRGPVRAGGDWVSKWSVTDGGLDIRDVIVSESWRGEVGATEVLDRLITVSGLSRGEVRLGKEARWARGYVAAGTIRNALAAVARVTSSVIVVQDGAVQAWPIGGVRRTSGILLSPSSGLIDTPEPLDGGAWRLRSFLLPGTRPGDGLRVESPEVTGTMRVLDVLHDVDTEGTSCDTVLTVRAA